MLHKKCRKNAIDLISTSFRHSLEPDTYRECESHRHEVLLIEECLATKDEQRRRPMYAYHLHGNKQGHRMYERFEVKAEEVCGLKWIGHTARTPQEIEALCEMNLGALPFTRDLTYCYTWPVSVQTFLSGEGINALYTGFIDSHSSLSANAHFVAS